MPLARLRRLCNASVEAHQPAPTQRDLAHAPAPHRARRQCAIDAISDGIAAIRCRAQSGVLANGGSSPPPYHLTAMPPHPLIPSHLPMHLCLGAGAIVGCYWTRVGARAEAERLRSTSRSSRVWVTAILKMPHRVASWASRSTCFTPRSAHSACSPCPSRALQPRKRAMRTWRFDLET